MTYAFGALLLALTLGAAVYRRMQRRPGDSARAMAGDMVAGAAIYAFVGPAVGMAVIALITAIAARSLESLMMALYGLPWSYLFGIVPALLCGLAAGALKPLAPSWRANLRMGLLGALYGFAFILVFAHRDLSWSKLGLPLYMGALPGAAAGLICARLLYGKRAPTR
ncbi:hypothetical protein ACFWP0_13400 [Achromobacter sp. NPDC058515]|uniref:hypothetical protein n=1 Tax=Achromobacter sp. NPDC058515 TaxID=3346533 RepID=UPI003665D100